MRKRSDEEKQFIESIDRLLSGEEVEGFEDMSEDYHTAINFARNLAELRAEPSPEFRDRLKQRLLLQLTRQEVETAREKERRISFWEFLKNLVPQSPAWRTATVTIAVVLVTVGVLWRTGMFTQAPGLETTVLEAPATESLERGVAPKVGAPPPAPSMERATQFPQGAMEKVIELNQSQTVNGITLTLERVELSASEVKFYAFNVPPDYSLPQGSDRPPPSLMALHAYAEYSLDNAPTIDAGTSGIRFLDNGMRHIWSMLDPVPKDARELTFIITGLGEWEGPWVFTISLQD